MSDQERKEQPESPQATPAEKAAETGGSTEEPAIETPTPEQIEELKQKARERDEIWDRFLRTAAEFENRRKRLEQDAERRIRYGQQGLLKDLLPVLGDLSRALQTCDAALGPQETQSAAKPVVDGIRLVEKRLHDVLAKHNVFRIKTVGEKFDPNLHEAVGIAPPDKYPEGTVAKEVAPGWTLEDRVVQAAKVVVAKEAGDR